MPNQNSTTPATNPFEFRYVRSTGCHEVIDTRRSGARAVAFFDTSWQAEDEANRLWMAELMARPVRRAA
jgi:hypothetical protein